MTSTKPEPAVEAKSVIKVFNQGKPNKVLALDDVSVAVGQREFISLIGPSGCGKSTILRLMAALTHPTEGTVLVNGKPADQARQDRDYGMAFQTAGLFDWRTVSQNVELPLQLMGWSKSDRRQRAEEMLDLVRLEGFDGHYPRELSGGMQQRVAIARALSFSPSSRWLRSSTPGSGSPRHGRINSLCCCWSSSRSSSTRLGVLPTSTRTRSTSCAPTGHRDGRSPKR